MKKLGCRFEMLAAMTTLDKE